VPAPPPTLDFTLSSFNVLGSSHTSGTGRGKGKKAGMAPGAVRARWTAELIRRHEADVVGFQELQSNQLAVLRRHTNLEFFPGSSMRRADGENSIGWRRDRWTAVETRTLTVSYFNGNKRQMPYVRLRNVATGLEAWFANFHNPADTRRFPAQARFRSEATDAEVALANRLVSETDTPVFITGDMNDRDDYFCRLTGGAPMLAARGGSNNGVCRPGNPRAVDWIFGSQGVLFTEYLEDRSELVDRTSDHPMLVAKVHLSGRSTDLSSSLAGAGSSD
jgi:Endonuclease/Exonuclease/phosphatase family